MKPTTRLAIVLGIRPDLIRASLILKSLQSALGDRLVFIWSGQHYSGTLKDVFLRELELRPPDIELNAGGDTDAQTVGLVVQRLYPVLSELRPAAAVFLGDTNTVMGCLAAAQLNIPIVHIEGCMRSYDWRMPEEKYRTAIDHLSDVIYVYFDEYKRQGILEGLSPNNIVVVQNLIVDVLNAYYFERSDYFASQATLDFFSQRGLARGKYYLATCHRRENVEDASTLARVFELFARSELPVYFTASYRTQKNLTQYQIALPRNVSMVDPIGYEEMLLLTANARGIFTDSGTVVEEAAVLQVPSVQMRRATERPQVYDCRSSVKFDPGDPERFTPDDVMRRLDLIVGTKWEHGLGDGASSQRVVSDLVKRLEEGDFVGHAPERYQQQACIARSWRDDGVE